MTRPRTAIHRRAPLASSNVENADYLARAALNNAKLDKHTRRRFPGQFGKLPFLPTMNLGMQGPKSTVTVKKRSKSRPKTALTRLDNGSPDISVIKPRNQRTALQMYPSHTSLAKTEATGPASLTKRRVLRRPITAKSKSTIKSKKNKSGEESGSPKRSVYVPAGPENNTKKTQDGKYFILEPTLSEDNGPNFR